MVNISLEKNDKGREMVRETLMHEHICLILVGINYFPVFFLRSLFFSFLTTQISAICKIKLSHHRTNKKQHKEDQEEEKESCNCKIRKKRRKWRSVSAKEEHRREEVEKVEQ